MIKKISAILIFFILTNCGYKPIFSVKNSTNLLIENIETSGDKNVNKGIISQAGLKNYNKGTDVYNLSLNSEKIIEVVAKNDAGNASVYKTTVTIKIALENPNDQGQIPKSKNFNSSFTYNSKSNKFDLIKYQRTVEADLINAISEEIKNFLSSF